MHDGENFTQKIEYVWIPPRCMKFSCFGHLTEACSLKIVWKEKESSYYDAILRKPSDNPRNVQDPSNPELNNQVLKAENSETNILSETLILKNSKALENIQIVGNKEAISNPEALKDDMDIILDSEQTEVHYCKKIQKITKDNQTRLNRAMDTEQKGKIDSAILSVPNGKMRKTVENYQQSNGDCKE